MIIARVTLVFQWKKIFFFYFDSILYNSDPYNNKCKRLPIYKFLVLESKYCFYVIDWYCWNRKKNYAVVSVAEIQSSLELGPSLKVCWTLCSFRWLRSSFRKTLYAIHIVTHWKNGIWFYLNKRRYFNSLWIYTLHFKIKTSPYFDTVTKNVGSANLLFLMSLTWPCTIF